MWSDYRSLNKIIRDSAGVTQIEDAYKMREYETS